LKIVVVYLNINNHYLWQYGQLGFLQDLQTPVCQSRIIVFFWWGVQTISPVLSQPKKGLGGVTREVSYHTKICNVMPSVNVP